MQSLCISGVAAWRTCSAVAQASMGRPIARAMR